jgi:lysine 6-dehydrogenase
LKVLVLGCGFMSMGTIYKLARDPLFTKVAIHDVNSEQIHSSFMYFKKVLKKEDFNKLEVWPYNMTSDSLDQEVLKGVDIILANVPWNVVKKVVEKLVDLHCEVPLISITRPNYQDVDVLEEYLKQSNMCVLFGAGLEPGLTELLAVYLSQRLDEVKELHIRCGGIPVQRTNSLGYKSVFGGKVLPFGIRESYQLKEKQIIQLPRFSEVEDFQFDEIKDLEVWNDGMLPWFPHHEKLKGLTTCTQKSIRYSGYAEKIETLKEMGFLDEQVKNDNHTNKQFTEEILHPFMKFSHSVDRDMVLLKITVVDANNHSFSLKLRDHYDETINMTAMARTTGFTIAILANILLTGIKRVQGMQKLERLLEIHEIETLLNELQQSGVKIEIKKEDVKEKVSQQR